MEILQFEDTKTVPDIIYKYSKVVRDHLVPIIINNGSYQCRVGWATDSEPVLLFKNYIAKPRKERSKPNKDGSVEIPLQPQLQVGNNIINVEAVRFQLKTPFDRNVVTHFEAQEHLMDYTFNHLGIDTDNCVAHPILITEPFLNPNTSRSLMSELLFECYNVPAVVYGIDSLFAYASTRPDKSSADIGVRDALLVSLGYHTVHVVPILAGVVQYDRMRRLNTGGYHITSFLHRILQLKYPSHANAITLSRSEELVRGICAVAVDYGAEVAKWADPDYYDSNIRRIQLPYVHNVANTLTAEQQKERKRELARRLTEINARKREERLAEDEDKLALYSELEDLRHLDLDEFERLLFEHSLRSAEDLRRNIGLLNTRIERTKQKIVAASVSTAAAAAVVTHSQDEIADEALRPPPKHSKYTKLVFESDKAMHVFLLNAKKMKEEILRKKACRKQRKQDMAKRRTAAGQERMRIISHLARKEKGNDDFGLRDEDWDIYKTISRDCGDSDSDTENEKLLELDEIIRAHEPTAAAILTIAQPSAHASAQVPTPTGSAEGQLRSASGGWLGGGGGGGGGVNVVVTAAAASSAEQYQLHIGVERFRAPELLFKPYMAGNAEAGLTELIGFVLSQFTADEQLRLAGNVLLDGGLANLHGLRDRLSADLRSIRPFQSHHQVSVVGEPGLAAWYGARQFATSPAFEESKVTREDYMEFGGEYLKTHFASNPYTASPKEITILEVESA